MKIKDVPQDDAGFLKKGKVRDVCYATDDEGNYSRVLSLGWDPKNEAIRSAWEQVNEKVEKIKQKVLNGKLSPLAFHMERCMMSVSMLSKYTGFNRKMIKNHLKPDGFSDLNQNEIDIYKEALNLNAEDFFTV